MPGGVAKPFKAKYERATADGRTVLVLGQSLALEGRRLRVYLFPYWSSSPPHLVVVPGGQDADGDVQLLVFGRAWPWKAEEVGGLYQATVSSARRQGGLVWVRAFRAAASSDLCVAGVPVQGRLPGRGLGLSGTDSCTTVQGLF